MRSAAVLPEVPKLRHLLAVGTGEPLPGTQRYEEALAAYEQAIHLDPSYAKAYNGKGIALDALKRNQEAQKAYEKARQLGYGSH